MMSVTSGCGVRRAVRLQQACDMLPDATSSMASSQLAARADDNVRDDGANTPREG